MEAALQRVLLDGFMREQKNRNLVSIDAGKGWAGYGHEEVNTTP